MSPALCLLDALLDTFPDAMVIQLHRDPAEAVSSLCSLCHALQTMDFGHSEPAATGAYRVEMVDQACPPCCASAPSGPRPGSSTWSTAT